MVRAIDETSSYDDHGITDLEQMLNHTGYQNFISQKDPSIPGATINRGDDLELINEAAAGQQPTATVGYYTSVNPHFFGGSVLTSFNFVDVLASPRGISRHNPAEEQYLSGFTVNPMIDGRSGTVEIRWTKDGKVIRKNRATWNFDLKPCTGCDGQSCHLNAALDSVHIRIPLGGQNYGLDSNELTYDSEELANAGPAGLKFVGRNGESGSTVNRAGDVITSVITGNSVAAVVPTPSPTDPKRFEIQFTYIDDPRPSPPDPVYRRITIESLPELRFSEYASGATKTYTYSTAPDGTWILDESGLRRTSKRTDSTSATTRTIRRKVEEKGSDGLWHATADETSYEQKFSWGWEVTRLVTDPDGAALESSCEYYDDSTSGNSNPAAAGRLKSDTSATGLHRSYEYLESDPFNANYASVDVVHETNGALAKETRVHRKFSAGTLTSLEEVIEGGFLVSKKEIVATATGRIEKVYPSENGAPQITSISNASGFPETTRPDGTVRKVIQSIAAGQLTETVYEGTKNPNAGHYLFRGTETVTIVNKAGDLLRFGSYRIHAGVRYRVEERVMAVRDHLGRPERIDVFKGNATSADYCETYLYNCCGLAEERGRDGITSYHYYDALGRRVKTHRNGAAYETVYDGLTTRHHRYPEALPSVNSAADADTESDEETLDLTGVVTVRGSRSPKDGRMVFISTQTVHRPAGMPGRRVVVTFPVTPDDGNVIPSVTEDYAADGRLLARYGPLVIGQKITYGANAAGRTETSSKMAGDGSLFETEIEQRNWAGIATSRIFAGDGNGDQTPDRWIAEYDAAGRILKSIDADGVVSLFSHDAAAGIEVIATDCNGNGAIDYAVDRISIEREGVASDVSGEVIFWNEEACRDRDSQGASIERTLWRKEQSASGLAEALFTYGGSDVAKATSRMQVLGAGEWDIIETAADKTSEVRRFRGGVLAETERFADGGKSLFKQTFGYDSHKRPVQITDSRGPSTTYHYVSDQVDRIDAATTGGRTSTMVYDDRGRLVSSDEPDSVDANGQAVANTRVATYWPHGGVREESGTPGYRASYTYDASLRLQTLTTHGTTDSQTRWDYDADRGWLVAKIHDSGATGGGSGEHYTYTPAGRVLSKTDARNIAATREYDSAGDVAAIRYSDATATLQILERDQRGNVRRLIDGAGEQTWSYNAWGEPFQQGYTGASALAGWTVTQNSDAIGRLSGLAVTTGATGIAAHDIRYGYNTAGRLESVLSGGNTASYQYDAIHQRLSQVGIASGASPVLYGTFAYDALLRLKRISYHNGGANNGFRLYSDFSVTRDDAGRIGGVTQKDHTHWSFGYHGTGEIAAAEHEETDGNAVLRGQSYSWSYDGIGNRINSTRGEDSSAALTHHAVNASNQCTLIQNPSFADVIGLAPSAQSVAVNGAVALRQGTAFHQRVTGDNLGGPAWLPVNVTCGSSSKSGFLLLPPAAQAIAYDADGNLVDDGIHHFTWDAENRLVGIETTAAAVQAGAPYQRVACTYDSMGRRVQRLRFDSLGAGSPAQSTRYLWAGWRCLAEIGDSGAITRSYVWGQGRDEALHLGDGNGALLWTNDHVAGTTRFFHYDGNGNVVGLSSPTGEQTAEYAYTSFGELIARNGPDADANLYRFSTQPFEEVGGLYYYGYRFLDPVKGRWLSRDPLGEEGGMNLYGFVDNDGVNAIDRLGGEKFNIDLAAYMGEVRAPVVNALDAVIGLADLGLAAVASPWSDADEGLLLLKEAKLAEGRVTKATVGNAAARCKTVKAPFNVGGAIKPQEFDLDFKKLLAEVRAADFSTKRNGAVFWSGFHQGNKARAMEWARVSGKQTLEMTPGGKWLEKLDLYGPNSKLTSREADNIWRAASAEFARNASGTVNVFTRGTYVNLDKVFYGLELRLLKINSKVNPTIIYRGY